MFPTNASLLDGYPGIKRYFSKVARKERSDKQIFRLLDNLHYAHVERLVVYLDKWLSDISYGDFVFGRINNRDLIQFKGGLYEIYVLDKLLSIGYSIDCFDDFKGQERVPEFLGKRNQTEFLFEHYNPIDLYGYEELFEELRIAIKYVPVNRGFEATIDLVNKKSWGDQSRLYFPYDLRDRYGDDYLRKDVIRKAVEKFSDVLLGPSTTFEISLGDDLVFRFKVDPEPDPANRHIVLGHSTTSYSSVLKFDMGDCSTNDYYKKVKAKVDRGQLSHPSYPSAIKVLLVDMHGFDNPETLLGIGPEKGGYYHQRFVERVPICMSQLLEPEDVDLVYPIFSSFGGQFHTGNCVFNPQDLPAEMILPPS